MLSILYTVGIVLTYVVIGFSIGRVYARHHYPDYPFRELNSVARDTILFVVWFWWLYLIILILGYIFELFTEIHNRIL